MVKIIDADAHVIECEETWDHLQPGDERFRPIPVADPDGGHAGWLVDGQLVAGAAGDPSISKDIKELRDVPGRLAAMDGLGIDAQVLFPTFFIGLTTDRPEVQRALAKTYNRWLAHVWSQSDGRLPWVVVPPLLDLEASLEEIDLAAEHGAHGVFMRGIEGDRVLTDPYLFPIYEKAQELGLPISIHAGTGSGAVRSIYYGQHETRSRDVFAAANLPVLGAFHLLVTSGIPDRFPDLRFGFIETGAQWVPYLVGEALRRQETMTTEGTISSAATVLADKNLFVAVRTDNDLAGLVEGFGSTNFVMGTDFGHEDAGTEVDAFSKLRAEGSISDADLDRVMSDNARALYAL